MKLRIVFFFILALPSILYAQRSIQLSQLELTYWKQDYSVAQRNKSVINTPFSISKKNYKNGVGVLSNSKVKIDLHKDATFFRCWVGLNDVKKKYKKNEIQQVPMTDGTMVYYKKNTKKLIGIGDGNAIQTKGTVLFSILADGKEVYNSGLIRTGDLAKRVEINLKGVRSLILKVEDGDDGIAGDYANWVDAEIGYNKHCPIVIPYNKHLVEQDNKQAKALFSNLRKLKKRSLSSQRVNYDWLIDNHKAKANVYQSNSGKELILSNGLVSRAFTISPNIATISFQNEMTGESLLRVVSSEGEVVINNKKYSLGGLLGQKDLGYFEYEWLNEMYASTTAFQLVNFEIKEIKPYLKWAKKRWSLKSKRATGKELIFELNAPRELKGLKVYIHYELYDGIPCFSKWIEVINISNKVYVLNRFVLEKLAMVEAESLVEMKDKNKFRHPNIHIESDWGFLGMTEKEADRTEHWVVDSNYKSQVNYGLQTPCRLEVKLPMGPEEKFLPHTSFNSFRTWLMPYDSDDRGRKGLFRQELYANVIPWVTENPIFMHCTSSDPTIVKKAIDQCAETGYEMLILSFGSGLNMEDDSSTNYEKFKKLNTYAKSKGIELGGYSLLSSRWISDDVDVINPKTGKRGGMIFGSSPCLCTEWGKTYFQKIKTFFEKTGMTVFENDGSYPGNVCASKKHKYHEGLLDSQWKQRKEISTLYQWMCEQGIYMNVPDYGYFFNGASKTGIGYREVNWSLPRERQLVHGRQNIYDGLWNRLPSMCWTFVPLVQYHGGGAVATLEPLSEHLKAYEAHMMQNYGSGVQACYRGTRLYDTAATKTLVQCVITWYKKYRKILNSPIIHLRRPDGRDWDGLMHVNPNLKEKGFVMLYNPTKKEIKRKITLPLYYTGLKDKVNIREKEGKVNSSKLSRDYKIEIPVVIPAQGYTWFVLSNN